jgi:hypothetical protein
LDGIWQKIATMVPVATIIHTGTVVPIAQSSNTKDEFEFSFSHIILGRLSKNLWDERYLLAVAKIYNSYINFQ